LFGSIIAKRLTRRKESYYKADHTIEVSFALNIEQEVALGPDIGEAIYDPSLFQE
jgi:hypothetical protein